MLLETSNLKPFIYMAQIYVKVPHYVASFWRNRDEAHPVMPWSPVDLMGEFPFRQIVDYGLMRNERLSIINRVMCLNEWQWREMMKGKTIFVDGNGKISVKLRPAKRKEDVLTVADVYFLCGKPVPKNWFADEYLCIGIPSTWYNDKTHKWMVVDNCWQLMDGGVDRLRAWLQGEFVKTLLNDKAEDELSCRKRGLEFNLLDFLERFMLRYDIRNSTDNHEKSTVKKVLQRAEKKGRVE